MTEIGRSIRRVEDDRLLRGAGRFLADIKVPGTLEIVFLRSTEAHAHIRGIDAAAARVAPGVAAVFTAADLEGRTKPLCVAGEVHTPERLERELGLKDRLHPIPLLPDGKVTYVGQVVAMIVAESRNAALDAAELIEIAYEALPAVIDPVAALAPDAPLVEPGWGTNLAFSVRARKGDADAAFATAPVVLSEEFRSHRYVASPLEARGLQASLEPVSGDLTLWASTQMPHVLLNLIAASLKLAPERIRVVACDVGGGFGQKAVQYVEDILVAFAALTLARPVRWVEERGENLIAGAHSRVQVHRISVAATEAGRMLAIRDEVVVDFGAFNVLGLIVPYNTLAHLLGPYDIAHADIAVQGVLTNTCLTAPYRGAGRPEAVFAMERIVDRLAVRLGIEPAELRRRNLVPAGAMPYTTGLLGADALPQVYDSGDFPELLRRARALIDIDGVRARQRGTRADGRLLGVGLSLYVEGTGTGPFEGAVVRVLRSGRIQVATGACSQGQGHQTVYAQIVADALGVPVGSVDVVGGDTATIAFGMGTFGSRSTVTAGSAIHQAALKVKERALAVAGDMLEAAPSDLEIVEGIVRIRGVPQPGLTLPEIARAVSRSVLRQGAAGDGLLAETAYFSPPAVTFASAAHAVIVAVDPATGHVEIERYLVVHDCGRVINPMLVEGQVAGGVAQGIGGALYEELVYAENGQLLSGSLMDYALPIASYLPAMEFDHIESLSPRNPLGVKGVGEGGAIGPPAAIANAVEDALRPLGVVIRQGPLSPGRLGALIAAARTAQ